MAAKNPNHPKLSYLVGLPNDVTVTNIVKREHCDELFISFKPPELRCCPRCYSNNCVVKDSGYTQTVRHIPVAQRGTIVTFHKRRLLCKGCRTSFTERPEWLHPSLHITNALYHSICLDLTQMLSTEMVARTNWVSSNIVSSVLDTIDFGRPSKLPETLCVDEFKGSSGEWDTDKSRWDVDTYHCNIVDGGAGFVIDILPKITAEYLAKYFRQFSPNQRMCVKYFCCDMHNGFVSVAKELFPHARICIDMFHVIRLINDTIDAIRRRLQNDTQNRQDNDERYAALKNASRSLRTSEVKQERLGNPNNAIRLEKLHVVFDLFPELTEAYNALQEFHFICEMTPPILQKASLTDWIQQYSDSKTPELEKLARSIRYWRGYIQNAWQYHHSNSACEGFNNKIKVLKRISYGMHCFESFRKRVLLTCGYIRLANEPFTIFHEKRNGKGVKL